MPDDKKSYKVGDQVYDVPSERSAAFLQKHPDAYEVQSYTIDNDTFDVPLPRVDAFLQKHPLAKPLFGGGGEDVAVDELPPEPQKKSSVSTSGDGASTLPEGRTQQQISSDNAAWRTGVQPQPPRTQQQISSDNAAWRTGVQPQQPAQPKPQTLQPKAPLTYEASADYIKDDIKNQLKVAAAAAPAALPTGQPDEPFDLAAQQAEATKKATEQEIHAQQVVNDPDKLGPYWKSRRKEFDDKLADTDRKIDDYNVRSGTGQQGAGLPSSFDEQYYQPEALAPGENIGDVIAEKNRLLQEKGQLGLAVHNAATVAVVKKYLVDRYKPLDPIQIGKEVAAIDDPSYSGTEKAAQSFESDLGLDAPGKMTNAKYENTKTPPSEAAVAANEDKRKSYDLIQHDFYKGGAYAIRDYYKTQSATRLPAAKPYIDRLVELTKDYGTAKTMPEKRAIQQQITALLNTGPVKAYSEVSDKVTDYNKKGDEAAKLWPSVARSQDRQKINDAWAEILRREDMVHKLPTGYTIHPGALTDWLIGKAATEEDAQRITDELADEGVKLDVNYVKGIINERVKSGVGVSGALSGKGFWSGLGGAFVGGLMGSPKVMAGGMEITAPGVRTSGFVQGIGKSATETIGMTVQGLNRAFDVNDVDAVNRVLRDKINAYMMEGEHTKLIDEHGKYNVNMQSIMNAAGRGIGQTAVLAAPALATGGLGAGIGVAAGLTEGGLAASALTTGLEWAGTIATGYYMSYEPSYQEAALYTENEGVRRKYAHYLALANAIPEIVMSPADIVKMTGGIFGAAGGKAGFEEFMALAAQKGVNNVAKEAVINGLKTGGEVILAENLEEQYTNLAQSALQDQLLGSDIDLFYKKNGMTPPGFIEQAIQTMVMTTIQTAPLAIGAGIGARNDFSGIRKEGYYNAGYEADTYRQKLDDAYAAGTIDKATYNQKMTIVNTMAPIVAAVTEMRQDNGAPYEADDQQEMAAQQYRITVNKALKKAKDRGVSVTGEEEKIEEDNTTATAIQNEIMGRPMPVDQIPATGLQEVHDYLGKKEQFLESAITMGNVMINGTPDGEKLLPAEINKILKRNAEYVVQIQHIKNRNQAIEEKMGITPEQRQADVNDPTIQVPGTQQGGGTAAAETTEFKVGDTVMFEGSPQKVIGIHTGKDAGFPDDEGVYLELGHADGSPLMRHGGRLSTLASTVTLVEKAPEEVQPAKSNALAELKQKRQEELEALPAVLEDEPSAERNEKEAEINDRYDKLEADLLDADRQAGNFKMVEFTDEKQIPDELKKKVTKNEEDGKTVWRVMLPAVQADYYNQQLGVTSGDETTTQQKGTGTTQSVTTKTGVTTEAGADQTGKTTVEDGQKEVEYNGVTYEVEVKDGKVGDIKEKGGFKADLTVESLKEITALALTPKKAEVKPVDVTTKPDFEAMAQRYLDRGDIVYTDEDGTVCAERGGSLSFTPGGKWTVIKDLAAFPTHEQGGVDLVINGNGVFLNNANGHFMAAKGLVIKGEETEPVLPRKKLFLPGEVTPKGPLPQPIPLPVNSLDFVTDYYNSPGFEEKAGSAHAAFAREQIKKYQPENRDIPVKESSLGYSDDMSGKVVYDMAKIKEQKADFENVIQPHELTHFTRKLTDDEAFNLLSRTKGYKDDPAVQAVWEDYQKGKSIARRQTEAIENPKRLIRRIARLKPGQYDWTEYAGPKFKQSVMRSEQDIKQGIYDTMHRIEPGENYAAIMAIRNLLYQRGYYDIRKGQPMDKATWEKAMADPEIRDNWHFKMLEQNYELNDIFELNNEVASVDKKPDQLTAKKGLVIGNGGGFKGYQNIDPAKYETQLTPTQEAGFQHWLDRQYKRGRIQRGDYQFYKEHGYGYDYDFRAAFLAKVQPQLNKDDKKWHWNDYGKKPNEPTFSDESKYHGVDGYIGGTWDDDNFSPPPQFEETQKDQLTAQGGLVVPAGDPVKKPAADATRVARTPEIRTVQATVPDDPDSQQFYGMLQQLFPERYQAILHVANKFGLPKVVVTEKPKSGIYKNAYGYYNPLTETITLHRPHFSSSTATKAGGVQTEEDEGFNQSQLMERFLAEYAHHIQKQEKGTAGMAAQWLANDLPAYITGNPLELTGPYDVKGTIEHNAHWNILPRLLQGLDNAAYGIKNEVTPNIKTYK